jgi:hypothetical protein
VFTEQFDGLHGALVGESWPVHAEAHLLEVQAFAVQGDLLDAVGRIADHEAVLCQFLDGKMKGFVVRKRIILPPSGIGLVFVLR